MTMGTLSGKVVIVIIAWISVTKFVTTGGMVVVERLQDVVEIELCLKIGMGNWCFREFDLAAEKLR